MKLVHSLKSSKFKLFISFNKKFNLKTLENHLKLSQFTIESLGLIKTTKFIHILKFIKIHNFNEIKRKNSKIANV
jgi:hypothetical protein